VSKWWLMVMAMVVMVMADGADSCFGFTALLGRPTAL